MAAFISFVSANTTGKGKGVGPQTGPIEDTSPFEFEVPSGKYVQEYRGLFTYPIEGMPEGRVEQVVIDKNGAPQQFWNAGGDDYDAAKIADILVSGNDKQLVKYLFRSDDELVGSRFDDRLAGWKGKDRIDGDRGNDKLWGGNGADTFRFNETYDKDTIKDFQRNKDTIALDSNLAKNFKQVKKAAEKYDKGVILDFGSDKLKIEGLKKNQLDTVDFDFV
ncbi:hypothetical protein [Bauldia sp.]|uniref:hypothetical protein n=1 Tax=Bauldia sp. TaxID=2575872 RepID=UPI003BAC98FF